MHVHVHGTAGSDEATFPIHFVLLRDLEPPPQLSTPGNPALAMLYAVVAASAIAFSPPAAVRSHAYMTTKIAAPVVPTMSASARRAQLGALASGLAGLVATSQAASAAEVRSTPWAMSTFLDAIDSDLIEKVSFSADGKQALAIVRARSISRAPSRWRARARRPSRAAARAPRGG